MEQSTTVPALKDFLDRVALIVIMEAHAPMLLNQKKIMRKKDFSRGCAPRYERPFLCRVTVDIGKEAGYDQGFESQQNQNLADAYVHNTV